MKIIIGSSSPRRQQYFRSFSLPIECAFATFDERSIPLTSSPEKYVQSLSEAKALSLMHQYPDDVLLTFDSIVFHENAIYNKPENASEAKKFLLTFSGKKVDVLTSCTMIYKKNMYTKSEKSVIYLRDLSKTNIEKYVAICQPFDKAGGFSVQDAGGLLIEKIDGSYYNILGIPVSIVEEFLLEVGIHLWDFLKP